MIVFLVSTKEEDHTLDVGDPDNRLVRETLGLLNWIIFLQIFLAPAAPESSQTVHSEQCGQQ